MKHRLNLYLKKIALSVAFFSCISTATAQDKVPDKVMFAYQEYAEAMRSGDGDRAITTAKAALRLAEKELGDHKFTGDLAYILATLPIQNDYALTRRQRNQAFGRAIELSSLHDNNTIEILMSRHLSRIRFQMFATDYGRRQRTPGGDGRSFLDMERALAEQAQEESVWAARFYTLYAKFHNLKNRPDDAIEAGERAVKIFASLPLKEEFSSELNYREILALEVGSAYEAKEKPLKAALHYQKNLPTIQNYQNLTREQKISITGFFRARAELEALGTFADGVRQGLCQVCGPSVSSPTTIAVMQTPPFMPPKAEYSGEVVVKFKLDRFGQVFSPKILASTDTLYHKNTLEAVRGWRYSTSPHTESEYEPRNRVVRIEFVLTDGKNRKKQGRSLKSRQSEYGLDNPILKTDEVVSVKGQRFMTWTY